MAGEDFCMPEISDLWTQDSFEDTVARALITCFESRIKKSRGAGPQSLNAERMSAIRKSGPYIPGSDREIIAPASVGAGVWEFDMVNDPLPMSGCIGIPIDNKALSGQYGGFFRAIHIQKKIMLSQNWHRRGGGQLYEMIYAVAQNEFVEGERSFFSVESSGKISACQLAVPSSNNCGMGGKPEFLTEPESHLKEVEACASVALQYIADSRYCWSIEAREHDCFARLGCVEEQVKSLLYARSLPMTETGRKRPILHLVEAHKRRMKNGTDINVSSSLRGIQVIEMGGTQFTVRPPKSLTPELSKASRNRIS